MPATRPRPRAARLPRWHHATWQKTFAINLFAPVYFSRACAPLADTRGWIVNITSIAARPALPRRNRVQSAIVLLPLDAMDGRCQTERTSTALPYQPPRARLAGKSGTLPETTRACLTSAEVYEMRGDEIIDVDADPKEARREFWQRIGRFGIPLVGVVLIVGAIIAIAFYSYSSNRSDALGLSQNLIETLDQRVQTEVEAYLTPAAHAVQTVAGLLPKEGLSSAGRPLLEKLAMQLLRHRPQLASLYVGDPEGNFLMVQRSPEGALDTKVIQHEGDQRQVTWYRRDEAGRVEAVEQDPADTFDPRTRPWYRGATSVDGLFWTDAYIFFTEQKPGLTASRAVYGPDKQIIAVAGGDIALGALSDFLAGLEIGQSGRAMIIDGEGRLVAFPDPAKVVEAANGEFRPAQLAEIGDPLLTKVYDRIRVSGDGQSIVEIDGQRYIVAGSSLAEAMARDWSLVFVVPEKDFVGFVAANSRKTLLMSGGIVALAVGLAALLAYQGLVADRNARFLGPRERALAA
jgi:adenylate cyclase